MSKSPGQIAYERDCELLPTYHDGTPRRAWDQLHVAAQRSWEHVPSDAVSVSPVLSRLGFAPQFDGEAMS